MSKGITEKLAQLRHLMKEQGLDFYYVPSSDAHNNEYVPKTWRRREWISGFTGSAGSALIGLNEAYLWTDARYFLQAEQELDPEHFQLMQQMPGKLRPDEWLQQKARGLKIGVDPKVISHSEAQRWKNYLKTAQSELIFLPNNFIDAIWVDREKIPAHPILRLDLKYSGETTESKLNRLLSALDGLGAQNHIISALDAIAWLFNIRGKDIEFNPLVISYAIIRTASPSTLYLNTEILSDEDKQYFFEQKMELKDYDSFYRDLSKIRGKTLVDPSSNAWILEELSEPDVLLAPSPISLMKACKNSTEQAGMQEAHRRDGLAMIKFLFWLESQWSNATEMSAASKLDELRRTDPYCQDLSFTTISGYGDHGAIIHYSVNKKTDRPLGNDSLYLVDSGGQYLQGTTDITRTLHLGNPTAIQKKHYTLVLKGHVALGSSIFPSGTCGEHLNALAHLPLWQEGLDYPHGTGHGVGCFLCVHEGPQSISSYATGIPLQPGMVVSNEPGLYLPGEYGIRIENVCLVTERKGPENSPGEAKNFYQFVDLSLVPYDKKLIDKTLLSESEIEWINRYHERILRSLSPDLPQEMHAWLAEKTSPL